MTETANQVNKAKVYINGELIGSVNDPIDFTKQMREKRRAGGEYLMK